jgi:hypothetical protein
LPQTGPGFAADPIASGAGMIDEVEHRGHLGRIEAIAGTIVSDNRIHQLAIVAHDASRTIEPNQQSNSNDDHRHLGLDCVPRASVPPAGTRE